MKIPKVNHMKNFNVNDQAVGLVVLMFLKFYMRM